MHMIIQLFLCRLFKRLYFPTELPVTFVEKSVVHLWGSVSIPPILFHWVTWIHTQGLKCRDLGKLTNLILFCWFPRLFYKIIMLSVNKEIYFFLSNLCTQKFNHLQSYREPYIKDITLVLTWTTNLGGSQIHCQVQ